MAIIFDLDGTLLDSLPLHEWTLIKGAEKILGKHPGISSIIRENIRHPSSIIFKLLAKRLNTTISTKTARRIIEAKRKFLTPNKIRRVRTFDHARELLEFLKKEKIKYCIATSMTSPELKRFEKELKLKKISYTIVNPDAQIHEKPNPYIINLALRRLKAKRKGSIYVGDGPFDYVAAKRAGIGFIGVYNRKELKRLGPFFDNFARLDKYIRRNLDHFRE
jgi:HAD superfamily hydrolase (TIGR01549 family)